MEDCGREGYKEEEEERGSGRETGERDEQQTPNDKEWWMGKDLPPTVTLHHLQQEDIGRHRQEQRNQRPDCAREWQS
jgi:hypothetical protein